MERFTLWFFGIVGFAAQLAFMPAAHADPAPVRCKDVPGGVGTQHICQYPDGSITDCWGVGMPMMCAPVYMQLAPGFWDQP